MTNNTLNNVLTIAIAITVISATYLFIAPGLTLAGDLDIDTTDTIVEPTPRFAPAREQTEIESLVNDVMCKNPANKGTYSHNPDKVSDVHVCINMAVDQAIWITENYEYDVGIVLLHRKTAGDNHAQTWVIVDDVQYVIDSTSNYYWTVDRHVDYWGTTYKIQYTTIKKGQEIEKENNEWLNNKNEPQINV